MIDEFGHDRSWAQDPDGARRRVERQALRGQAVHVSAPLDHLASRQLPPDEELVRRLGCSDEAAFALVVDAWSSGMLRLARYFVSSPDSAAEVVQDAWLGVIEGIDRFEGRSSLTSPPPARR